MTSTSKPSWRSAAVRARTSLIGWASGDVGVRIMTVADHECDPGRRRGGALRLLGLSHLRGVQRPLVQRRMRADAQGHRADQRRRNDERTTGPAKSEELPKQIHHWSHSAITLLSARRFGRARHSSGLLGWGAFAVEMCSICGAATKKSLTRPVRCPQPYLSVNGTRRVPVPRAQPGRISPWANVAPARISLKLQHLSCQCCSSLQVWGENCRGNQPFSRGVCSIRAGPAARKDIHGVS